MKGWLRERSHAFAHTVSLYVKPYGESALSKPQRFLWTLPQASGRRTSTTAWGSAPAFAHRAWPRSRRDHPRRRRRRRRHRNSRGRGIPGRRLRSLLGTPGSQPSRCDPASRAKERPAWTADDLSGVDQAGRRGRLLAFCHSAPCRTNVRRTAVSIGRVARLNELPARRPLAGRATTRVPLFGVADLRVLVGQAAGRDRQEHAAGQLAAQEW